MFPKNKISEQLRHAIPEINCDKAQLIGFQKTTFINTGDCFIILHCKIFCLFFFQEINWEIFIYKIYFRRNFAYTLHVSVYSRFDFCDDT